MISSFDSAEEAIDKTIKDLCQELSCAYAGTEEFSALVDAIAKLRSSKNPTIIKNIRK